MDISKFLLEKLKLLETNEVSKDDAKLEELFNEAKVLIDNHEQQIKVRDKQISDLESQKMDRKALVKKETLYSTCMIVSLLLFALAFMLGYKLENGHFIATNLKGLVVFPFSALIITFICWLHATKVSTKNESIKNKIISLTSDIAVLNHEMIILTTYAQLVGNMKDKLMYKEIYSGIFEATEYMKEHDKKALKSFEKAIQAVGLDFSKCIKDDKNE